MYAVIRAGGKQYRVAPGDVIRVETPEDKDGKVEFGDVLAVSAEAGSVVPAGSGALVSGEVVEQGRGAKSSSSTTSGRSNTRNCGDTGRTIPRCGLRRLRLAGSHSRRRSSRKKRRK